MGDFKTLDEVIKDMNKAAKETVVTRGLSQYNYDRIPFTSPLMNYCSYGGLPVGKLIEFYGEEHGGKTTTALDIIANYQHMQDAKNVLYVDVENGLDVDWAHKLGVDTDNNFIVFQPQGQTAEEILEFIINAVQTGEVGLWVLDSIGALYSDQESEKSLSEKVYAGVSAPVTRFSKKVTQFMHGTQCTGIGINQIRDDLNSSWGGNKTPGGHGWRHFCTVRMDFSRGRFYDKDGKEVSRGTVDPSGNIVNVNMIKNRACPPDRHIASYSLNYDAGVDYMKDLVELAAFLGILDKRGGWFNIVDVSTGEIIGEKIQGQKNLEEYLSQHEDILENVENNVELAIRGSR